MAKTVSQTRYIIHCVLYELSPVLRIKMEANKSPTDQEFIQFNILKQDDMH